MVEIGIEVYKGIDLVNQVFGGVRKIPRVNDNLVATIFDTMLDLPQVRLLSGLPNEVLRLMTSGSPIAGLS